jgi:hypothetical protein
LNLSANPHGVTTQKNNIDIFTVMRTTRTDWWFHKFPSSKHILAIATETVPAELQDYGRHINTFRELWQ